MIIITKKLGRWTTCTLLEISTDMTKERCSYWCMEPGYWREVQVLKVPRTIEEFYWKVCYINFTGISFGEFHIHTNFIKFSVKCGFII